ncbi:hypothetical protein ACJX0J_021843 [Zea mays]
MQAFLCSNFFNLVLIPHLDQYNPFLFHFDGLYDLLNPMEIGMNYHHLLGHYQHFIQPLLFPLLENLVLVPHLGQYHPFFRESFFVLLLQLAFFEVFGLVIAEVHH